MSEVRYFAFEGIVGAGKSRQCRLFFHELNKVWQGEIVATKEPGGSEIADTIRRVVQGTKFDEEMVPDCEQYLYAASRAQTLRTIVKPSLDRGAIVGSDRSVYTSISYQGFGRGLRPDRVIRINEPAVAGLWPHAAFFINTDIDIALSRIHDRDGDKFENMDRDFFERCIDGYKYVVANFPNVFEINGNGTVSEVHDQIWAITTGLLGLK